METFRKEPAAEHKHKGVSAAPFGRKNPHRAFISPNDKEGLLILNVEVERSIRHSASRTNASLASPEVVACAQFIFV